MLVEIDIDRFSLEKEVEDIIETAIARYKEETRKKIDEDLMIEFLMQGLTDAQLNFEVESD
jgi:hypothetical protein